MLIKTGREKKGKKRNLSKKLKNNRIKINLRTVSLGGNITH